MTPTTATERARRTVVRAARLFDGSDLVAGDPFVVIEGSSIASVGFGEAVLADAEVVDLGDATLLPGLVDTHVHLAFDASADPVGRLATRTDEEVLAAMREAGRVALAGGVTTLRDLGDRDYLSLRLRGEAGMPTVLSAGPPITTAAGHCHFLGGVADAGVAGVRAAVRQHAERGVDVIKIMATGGEMTPGTHQHLAQFSAEELRAAVQESHRYGLSITAHAHGTPGIVRAVAAGVDGLEHASFWSEAGVDDPGALVGRIAEAGIAVGATLGIVPVPGVVGPPEILRRLPQMIANTRRMHESGVRLVAGTDAGIAPVKPHDVLRHVLPQLVGLGMSPAAALNTITSKAAGVCGLADRKGRIALGYDADLFAVAGDPTADLQAMHQILAVYGRGRRVRA